MESDMTQPTRTGILPEAPHALTPAAALAALGVCGMGGLSDAEVHQRRLRHGRNAIMSRRKTSARAVFAHQFMSPVVYLLGAAAALAFAFGELEEGSAIAAVLAVNALIGFLTELKAARSIEGLRALGGRAARVRRDGHTRLIAAEELVPGDIVLIEAGDSIAADLRLLDASNLAADESTLTGESVAVQKQTEAIAADARLAERRSMLFKGTAVTRGSGAGVVTATGLQTELGRVSQLVEDAEAGSSPLEKKLARLSAQLVWATIVLAVIIVGVGLQTGDNFFLIVEAAIALAVAAIPEGLPIVATLALARGMWRMARQNALIERLSAVETLGATTIILTDKTGTLTENRMTVRRLWIASGEIELDGGGATHAAAGRKIAGSGRQLAADPQIVRLLDVAVLCNDATLGHSAKESSGDPMELALLHAGRAAGVGRHALLERLPIAGKHAFDAGSKMMTTVHRHDGQFLFAVKGAPEAVLAACARTATEQGDIAMDDAARAEWSARVENFGQHGLRVLACASKSGPRADAAPYDDLTLLGLVALEDPARADVPHAIEDCRRAGIRVVMVTGDHAVTARSIGRAVGLSANKVVEGRHMEKVIAGPQTLQAIADLREVGIFARVSPAEKLALVRAYQAAGDVVAMTGDGVNDAPALRQADIGVAMGLRGTDVAREAAAMILLDDAFPTIVKAIREGRVIFDNIRRFVTYLLSCNLSEVLVVGLAILFALPLPIMPLQILYLNLVTDVFPAFALAMGEGERDVLERAPRDPKEPIVGRPQWIAIVLQSIALSAGTFGALVLARDWLALDRESVVTVTFLTLAFAQLWHVFNMRHPRSGRIRNEVTRNPWLWAALALCTVLVTVPPYVAPLAHVLQLTPPSAAMWAVILGMSVAPLIVTQAVVEVLARLRA
jgi:Ca2+-transporting ATPase